MPYLAAIIAVLLAFIVWRERIYDKLTREREQAFRLERAGLLNRIQIPEAAPFIEVGPEEPQHIPFEDDDAFNEAQKVLAEVDYSEEEA